MWLSGGPIFWLVFGYLALLAWLAVWLVVWAGALVMLALLQLGRGVQWLVTAGWHGHAER